MYKNKLNDFEKAFELKVSNISKSVFQEILFVLSIFYADYKQYVSIDVIDNIKTIIISNINYYNNINKLGLYNLSLIKKNIYIRQSDIKTNIDNLNKRYKFLSSNLINEVNQNKILKLDRINKNMSDIEISEIKKFNKIKESIILKLHNKIKSMKISTCI
ncbi:hypothetical protein IOLA_010 [uncultured bacterium]|nr:hypothetical protein IOLA_010 [uncultured bacterium]